MIFSWLDIGCLLIILLFNACNKPKEPGTDPNSDAGDIETNVSFTLMPAAETGVEFSNTIIEDSTYNFFTYEYLYNGGGVAVGDLNGDSLPDLYFTSSFQENKLYINQGNFKFTDVTAIAGVGAQSGFKTGVSEPQLHSTRSY